jgi:homoserine kinase type II
VANYTAITFAECARFLAQLDQVLVHFSPLSGGAANSSFHAVTSTGKELVLTVLDNHDDRTATALGSLTKWLVCKGVETPPILHRDHLTQPETPEAKPVIIRPLIRGSQPAVLTAGQVGASMAAVHQLDGADKLGLARRRLPIDWEDTPFAAAELAHDVVHAAAKELEQQDTSRNCLIHGDLFPDIMIWDQAGRLHLLDWETAALDWAPLDLGFTLAGLAGGAPLAQEVSDALLAEYTEAGGQAPNPDEIRVGARYAGAVLLFYRYRRYVRQRPDPARFDYWTKLIPFMDSVLP